MKTLCWLHKLVRVLTFGKGYQFFQMPTIGGRQGLRGYRTERFYGKSSIWHDTDLRVKIGSSYNPTLPLTYGVFGSFDYGRVWYGDDDPFQKLALRLRRWYLAGSGRHPDILGRRIYSKRKE
jgi:hypothetical protein